MAVRQQQKGGYPSEVRSAALDRNPGSFELWLAGIVFLFASGLLDPKLAPEVGGLKINDFFVAIGTAVGWSILLTKMRGGFRWIDHHLAIPIVAFYLFVGISILWSGQPGQAAARYIGFVLVTGWTVYLTLRFEFRVLLRIIVTTFIAIGVVSALLAIFVPSIGTMEAYYHQGDWSGIYRQKNSLGRQMTLLILMSVFMLLITGETVEILGIPLSFTGRIGLWEFAAGFVENRPYFGYGYDGFWEVPRFGGQLVKDEGWLANDSHNGFYDLVLQTGFVGLGAFLLIYIMLLFMVGKAVRLENAAPAVQFSAFYIIFFFFANLTESYLLKATNVIQLLFSLAVMQLAVRASLVMRRSGREPIEILPSGRVVSEHSVGELPTDEIVGGRTRRPFFRPRRLPDQ